MSKLTRFADHLADLYRHRAQLQIDLAHAGQAERLRLTHLSAHTPIPVHARSRHERQNAFTLICDNDEALQKIRQSQSELRDTLTECLADIEALDTQFKAERWLVLQQLTLALTTAPLGETEFVDESRSTVTYPPTSANRRTYKATPSRLRTLTDRDDPSTGKESEPSAP